jgi:hypothetical protein
MKDLSIITTATTTGTTTTMTILSLSLLFSYGLLAILFNLFQMI